MTAPWSFIWVSAGTNVADPRSSRRFAGGPDGNGTSSSGVRLLIRPINRPNEGSDVIETFTYAGLAERLGCTAEAARALSKRKRWSRTVGNDGKARVQVDLEEVNRPPRPFTVRQSCWRRSRRCGSGMNSPGPGGRRPVTGRTSSVSGIAATGSRPTSGRSPTGWRDHGGAGWPADSRLGGSAVRPQPIFLLVNFAEGSPYQRSNPHIWRRCPPSTMSDAPPSPP
jgi:hypothetical protein